MSDDVVAELDRWGTTPRTEKNALEFVPINDLLQCARDEIVALRAQLEAGAPLRIAIADALAAARREARDEALEEAARVADGYCTDQTDDVARGIRALKDKRDE